eukprot:scaffold284327_cov29-Attheya_sp.AAC.1
MLRIQYDPGVVSGRRTMYGPRDAICCLVNTPRSMFVCVSLRTMTISPGSNVRGNRDLFFRAR